MNLSAKTLAIVLTLFLGNTSVNAADYYVSPLGDDNNEGTLENPWKTAKYAIENLDAGDNLYFRGGFYPVTSRITIQKSGSSGNWIKILAYENEVPVLDATLAPIDPDDAIINATDKNYIRIEGIHLQNSRGGGFFFRTCDSLELINNATFKTYMSGIHLAGNTSQFRFCNNVRIIGNYLFKPNYYALKQPGDTRTKAPHEGMTVGRVNNFEVAFNEVCYGDKEGIDCKGPTRNGTIHNNYVHHQLTRPFSVAVYLDCWTDDSLRNIDIHNNILYDCDDGVQIQSEDGMDVTDIRVFNNLIYNMGWSGIGASNNSVDKSNKDGITDRVYFWNNTVFNANDAVWLHGEINEIYFYNNILSSPRNNQIDNDALIDFDANNIVFEKNLFHSKMTENDLINLGIEDNMIGDPLFIDLETFNFYLQNGSPALGTGSTTFPFYTEGDENLGFASPGDFLQITTPHLLVTHESGSTSFDLITNQESPVVEVSESWIQASIVNNKINVNYKENELNQRRKGFITISAAGMEKTITLFQEGYYPVESLAITNCPGNTLGYRDRFLFEWAFEPYYATYGMTPDWASSSDEIAEFYNANEPNKIIINGYGSVNISLSLDGITDVCEMEVLDATNLNDSKREDLSLYPTIVENNRFEIRNRGKEANGTLSIYDITGMEVYKTQINKQHEIINPDILLTNGIYIVNLVFPNKIRSFRILVKNK